MQQGIRFFCPWFEPNETTDVKAPFSRIHGDTLIYSIHNDHFIVMAIEQVLCELIS